MSDSDRRANSLHSDEKPSSDRLPTPSTSEADTVVSDDSHNTANDLYEVL